MSKHRSTGNNKQPQQRPRPQQPPPSTQPPATPQPPPPQVDQLLIGTEYRSADRSSIAHKVLPPPEKK